jgi:hypothetical protein
MIHCSSCLSTQEARTIAAVRSDACRISFWMPAMSLGSTFLPLTFTMEPSGLDTLDKLDNVQFRTLVGTAGSISDPAASWVITGPPDVMALKIATTVAKTPRTISPTASLIIRHHPLVSAYVVAA